MLNICLLTAITLAFNHGAQQKDPCLPMKGTGAGIWRLHSAQSCDGGSLQFSAGTSYTVDNSFYIPKGRYNRELLELAFTWMSPYGLSLGLGGTGVFDRLEKAPQPTRRFAGSVNYYIKYGLPIEPYLSAGVVVSGSLPSMVVPSEGGNAHSLGGLVLGASTTAAELLLSYHKGAYKGALGAGYTLDQSRYLLKSAPDDEEAASLGIATENRAIVRGGLEGLFEFEWARVSPFLENTTYVAWPWSSSTLTVGGKLSAGEKYVFVIALAVDIALRRLSGGLPNLPYTPPWQASLQVAMVLDADRQSSDEPVKQKGKIEAEPRFASSTPEVKKPLAEIPIAQVSVTREMHIKVLDAVSERVMGELSVTAVDGSKPCRFSKNDNNALTCQTRETADGTLLQVQCGNYFNTSLTVSASNSRDGADVVIVRLQPIPGKNLYLKGSVRSALTGRPMAARVRVIETGETISVDGSGTFVFQTVPGTWTLVVKARGFKKQQQTVLGSAGGVVPINFDMLQPAASK